MAVVDLRLPDRSGLDVVRELKEIDPATAIVVLTGYGSIATALESVRLGATHYLTKPTDADRILAAFEHGLAARAARPADDAAVPGAGRMGAHPTACSPTATATSREAARQLGMHRRSLQRKLSKDPTAK